MVAPLVGAILGIGGRMVGGRLGAAALGAAAGSAMSGGGESHQNQNINPGGLLRNTQTMTGQGRLNSAMRSFGREMRDTAQSVAPETFAVFRAARGKSSSGVSGSNDEGFEQVRSGESVTQALQTVNRNITKVGQIIARSMQQATIAQVTQQRAMNVKLDNIYQVLDSIRMAARNGGGTAGGLGGAGGMGASPGKGGMGGFALAAALRLLGGRGLAIGAAGLATGAGLALGANAAMKRWGLGEYDPPAGSAARNPDGTMPRDGRTRRRNTLGTLGDNPGDRTQSDRRWNGTPRSRPTQGFDGGGYIGPGGGRSGFGLNGPQGDAPGHIGGPQSGAFGGFGRGGTMMERYGGSLGLPNGGAPAGQVGPGGKIISSADTDMPAHQRALLDTISSGHPDQKGFWESPNYRTIVGGGQFTDDSQHPNRVGVRTALGPSTAAGRYQFTATTWKRVVAKYNKENPNNPITDFSPKSQDRAAWWLAKNDYKRRLGRDLDADLKSGDPRLGEWLRQGLGGRGADTTWQIFQKKRGEEIGRAYEKNRQRNEEGDNSRRDAARENTGPQGGDPLTPGRERPTAAANTDTKNDSWQSTPALPSDGFRPREEKPGAINTGEQFGPFRDEIDRGIPPSGVPVAASSAINSPYGPETYSASDDDLLEPGMPGYIKTPQEELKLNPDWARGYTENNNIHKDGLIEDRRGETHEDFWRRAKEEKDADIGEVMGTSKGFRYEGDRDYIAWNSGLKGRAGGIFANDIEEFIGNNAQHHRSFGKWREKMFEQAVAESREIMNPGSQHLPSWLGRDDRTYDEWDDDPRNRPGGPGRGDPGERRPLPVGGDGGQRLLQSSESVAAAERERQAQSSVTQNNVTQNAERESSSDGGESRRDVPSPDWPYSKEAASYWD